MTSEAIHTPFDFSEPVKAGRRRFWKQILPVKSINYNGRKIDFDRKFHVDLAQSFRGEAFDQVPIVFADGENRHNMDPRNYGGDVLDVQARKDGTWALIEADKDAAKAIQRNPKLGVSARIRQGLEKADGRKFDRAIEHVLLTMNPRVTGMSPWQAVDLSEDADIEVVDLTAETYEEGNPMGTQASKPKATSDKIDLSNLSDDEFQTLLDLANSALADPEADEDEDLDDAELGDVEETSPVRKTRRKKSKTKITVEKDSEDDADDDDEEEDDDEDVANLSDADKVITRGEVSQFQQMRLDLAAGNWKSERGEYARAGVPPFLLDLAEPVLSLPDALTIDLSENDTLDASDTIRKMLDGVKGVVDLTGEIGHQVDLSESDDRRDETDKFLSAWDEQYG